MRILRRLGVTFLGRHEYVIQGGRVRTNHRDLLYVIWSDAQSTTYATPEGAAAMLDLLDEYSPPL